MDVVYIKINHDQLQVLWDIRPHLIQETFLIDDINMKRNIQKLIDIQDIDTI